MRPSIRLAAAAALIFSATLAVQPAPVAAAPMQWREVFSPDGKISQVLVPIEASSALVSLAPPPATVVALQQTGPSSQRFDLVFVGDGYTSSQLGLYHQHVAEKWAEISSIAPFSTYKNSFNVWMVDVVSSQSGVDNDPTQGISRATALDMYFWCGGTERLLCVNQTKAQSYAANAPQVDQIIALGNSTKYGGAGGGVATASGGNAQSGQIAIHELGHSIGGLADEYDYPYNQYNGSEPSEPNVTRYTAAALTSGRRKWYQLLGQSTPDGGVIAAYQGARYYKFGLYRPSQDSIMRTLGRQFNTIGLNVMTQRILSKVS